MNKHTSGQWVASPEENNNEWGIDSGVWGIAICADAPGDGTAEANARLIAAAPELLSLSIEIESYWSSGNFSRKQDLFEKLRAAIAKATGESK